MTSSKSTLYTHATIITINPSREIILDGAILVTDSRITAIGKSSDLESSIPSETKTISLKDRIIIPGLINTHAHLAQSLLRGLAENLPLHSWLCDAIWPLEACYDADDGYIAARLTIAEMLKSGTTTFLEAMLTHRSGFENVVKAVGESGIRACLGKLVKAPETNPALNITDPRDKDLASMSLPSLLAAHETHNNTFNSRIQVWAAAGTPRGSPLSAHLAIGETCQEHDIGLTMHCAEAPKDLTIYKDCYNLSPMQFCQQAKLTGPKTVLAHMVHLNLETDLEILRTSGTNVSHNPNSNLKLGNGVAKIPEMIGEGVNICLGTDGAPCGNSYDLIREMHLTAIIHDGVNQEAGLISAEDVLEMATINGARALGLEREIGSLEAGKKADFVVLDVSGVGCAPWDEGQVSEGGINPVTVVVHSCTGRDVDIVVVDGKTLVNGGKLVDVDEGEILESAKRAIKGIRERSGIKAKSRKGWKYV